MLLKNNNKLNCEFPFIYLQAMLVCKSVYLLITILVFKASTVNGSNQLHIGGIFPIGGKGGWQGGQGKCYLLCFNESTYL